MNWELWVIAVLAAALLIQSIRVDRLDSKLDDVRRTSSRLIANLHAKSSVQEYEALERGMDEQQESYEQEYLTWQEKEFEYMWELAHVMNDLFDAEHGTELWA